MKKYIYTIIISAIISLIGYIVYTNKEYNKLKDKYNISISNEKAYLLNEETLKDNIRALTLTVEQLEIANDSVLQSLNEARKNLKVKDDRIKYLQNIKTEVYITDTLRLKDTIFIKEDFKLDTLLGNQWYKTNLTMEYPNKIDIDFEYNSDLNVIAYTTRETVDPPKKCWLGRLFQKKHDVTRVEVKDNNPYSNIKDQTFVIIE
jgi:hypothetical protein